MILFGMPRRRLAYAILAGRYLLGAMFAVGCAAKLIAGWLAEGVLRDVFLQRLSEPDMTALQVAYLERFAIPFDLPVAYIVTVGELLIALGLSLGIATRASAALALFLLANFAAGGYYNHSMLPLLAIAALTMALPTGQWAGWDRQLAQRWPDSPWFR